MKTFTIICETFWAVADSFNIKNWWELFDDINKMQIVNKELSKKGISTESSEYKEWKFKMKKYAFLW